MKINQLFVESAIINNKYAQKIINHFSYLEPILIDKIENYFGKVKKPYLQKRESLSIFVGQKLGDLIKEAPAAYGTQTGRHFYHITSYNCLYECSYCYLQGYFDSPDIVFFVNHEQIINKMKELYEAIPHENIWFHAGEFSDSLALSNITDEWEDYWEFFKSRPRAFLEIRTKSSSNKNILSRTPLKNIIISFSLSPSMIAKEHELLAPSPESRIKSIKELVQQNFQIGLHFDPIFYFTDVLDSYTHLAKELNFIPENQLAYISLGVPRFTQKVFKQVKKNYSFYNDNEADFPISDNKHKYIHSKKNYLLQSIKGILVKEGIRAEKIYLCMENTD